jgi:NADH-quinone oxidoreductase subunit J
MVSGNLISAGGVPLVVAVGVIPPLAILFLCVVAGIGTLFLLPSHRPDSIRRLGGGLVAIGFLLFVAFALHATAGEPGPDNPVYFWLFSAIAVVSAIRVVTHPRPVYSALYFVLTVFASAGLFILLAADFLAAALVLIYAGAILVTYVFVIMLAAQATSADGRGALAGLAEYDLTSREPLFATCVGFALMGVLTFLIFDKGAGLTAPQPLVDSAAGQVIPASAITGPTQALGEYLFRHQLVNLEIAGLILTLAMVGAIIIARRRIVESPEIEDQAVEQILGPATPVNDDPHSIPVVGTRNPLQKAYPEN